MPPSVSAGCVDADVCGEKNRVRWANWFLFCYFVFEICECGMPVGLWSFFLSKLRSGKKPPLTASLWALLSVVIRVFTAVSQLSCFSSLLTLSTQFSLDQILKIRGSFSLGRLNQDRRFMLSRDINRPLLYPPHHQDDLQHLSCSSFWLAWYFLSLSRSMVRASGSVFLRGVESAAAEDHAGSGHSDLSSLCIGT